LRASASAAATSACVSARLRQRRDARLGLLAHGAQRRHALGETPEVVA
jgi:hypothetical protein